MFGKKNKFAIIFQAFKVWLPSRVFLAEDIQVHYFSFLIGILSQIHEAYQNILWPFVSTSILKTGRNGNKSNHVKRFFASCILGCWRRLTSKAPERPKRLILAPEAGLWCVERINFSVLCPG
jgi:hypothetical protein